MQALRNIANHIIPFSQNQRVSSKYNAEIVDKSVILAKGIIVSGGVLLSLALAAFAALGFTGVLPIGMVGSGLFTGGAGVAGGVTLFYVGGIAVGVIIRTVTHTNYKT